MPIDHTTATVELRDFIHFDEGSDYLLSISQYGKLIDVQLHINHAASEAKIIRCQELAAGLDVSYRVEATPQES